MKGAPQRISIVGAGAAGTLLAARIATEAGRRHRRVEISMIDPAGGQGLGPAYSTADPRHLLNVPVRSLSAVPEQPGHFAEWLQRNGFDLRDCDFAPRCEFGRYLRETLEETLAAVPWTGLRRVRARVERIDLAGPTWRVHLDTAEALTADAVALAIGQRGPSATWAPPALRGCPALVADPWRPGALQAVPADGDVLCVGTGLTMVDVAITLARPGRVVHAVSRGGVMPHRHFAGDRPAMEAPELPEGASLAELRAAVRAHLAKSQQRYGDWRPGFDSLRPLHQKLWAGLSDGDRREFFARDHRRWQAARHRMAPPTADAIEELQDTGRLVVGTGTVADAVPHPDGTVDVTLSDGRRLTVAAIVDCTGPSADVTTGSDPLLRHLLAAGMAQPGPLGLGLDTDADGRVRGAVAGAPLFTLGAMRCGTLWESTAIPEIRAQAQALARVMVEPAPPGTRRPRDAYGLPLSTTREAAEHFQAALDGIRRLEQGVEQHLARAVTAEPGFAVGHATLALVGAEWRLPVDVDGAIAQALSAMDRRADPRERSFVYTVWRRLTGTRAQGDRELRRHVTDYPRDAVAVSAALPTIAFSGLDEPVTESWALVERLAPSYGDDWWFAGIRAFAAQEQERYDEAARLARLALDAEPAAGHAVHALTHVFYETAEHAPGLQWLDEWIAGFGDSSTCRSHFAWHAALHELSLDDAMAVQQRYRRQLSPDAVTGARALVDSASLLWRAWLAGAWRGRPPIGPVLEVVPDEMMRRPASPFAALHAAIAAAADGDAATLQQIGRHASGQEGLAWECGIRPLVQGLADLVEQRPARAVLSLRTAAANAWRLGGSAAQQEIVLETLIAALVAAGQTAEAADLLRMRLDVRPCPLDRRRIATLRR